jgi:hypothetical protein
MPHFEQRLKERTKEVPTKRDILSSLHAGLGIAIGTSKNALDGKSQIIVVQVNRKFLTIVRRDNGFMVTMWPSQSNEINEWKRRMR